MDKKNGEGRNSLSGEEKVFIKEAIRCMKEIHHSLAIQANLWDYYKCDSPGTKNASIRRKKIEKALAHFHTLLP